MIIDGMKPVSPSARIVQDGEPGKGKEDDHDDGKTKDARTNTYNKNNENKNS
jgi:hypothetical protein